MIDDVGNKCKHVKEAGECGNGEEYVDGFTKEKWVGYENAWCGDFVDNAQITEVKLRWDGRVLTLLPVLSVRIAGGAL